MSCHQTKQKSRYYFPNLWNHEMLAHHYFNQFWLIRMIKAFLILGIPIISSFKLILLGLMATRKHKFCCSSSLLIGCLKVISRLHQLIYPLNHSHKGTSARETFFRTGSRVYCIPHAIHVTKLPWKNKSGIYRISYTCSTHFSQKKVQNDTISQHKTQHQRKHLPQLTGRRGEVYCVIRKRRRSGGVWQDSVSSFPKCQYPTHQF